MGQEIDKSILDTFGYLFFVMCLALSVYVGFRIRLQNEVLTTRERVVAHYWCVALAAAIATYFVALGIVTKEMLTVTLGFLIPGAFTAYDFVALRNLRILDEESEVIDLKKVRTERR